MSVKTIRVTKHPLPHPVIQLVQRDQNTQVLRFLVDKNYGGQDLTGLAWSVWVRGSRGESEVSYAGNVSMSGNDIVIDWNVIPAATRCPGITILQLRGSGSAGSATEYDWVSGIMQIMVTPIAMINPCYSDENIETIRQLIVDFESTAEGIGGHVDEKIAEQKTYLDGKLTAQKEYTDSKLSGEREYLDTVAAELKNYTDDKKDAANAYTDTKIADQKNFILDKVQEQQNYTDGKVSSQKSYVDEKTDLSRDEYVSMISILEGRQTLLSERMDTFTKLEEGSTTGDAELAGIRNIGDGVSYNNAGDAVRALYSKIKEIDRAYNDNYKNCIDPAQFSETGYYWSAAGTQSKTTDKAWRAYPAIHVYPGTYTYSNINVTSFSFVKFPNGTSEKLGASPRTFTTEADVYISSYNHYSDCTFSKGTNPANYLTLGSQLLNGNYDLNSFSTGESYFYITINASTLNAPVTSGSGILFTLGKTSPVFQVYMNLDGATYIRYKTTTWTAWTNYTKKVTGLTPSTVQPTDFNAPVAGAFQFCYTSAAANAPVVNPYGMLATWVMSNNVWTQSFTDWRTGIVYSRLKDNSDHWFDWHASNGERIIEVREGDDLYEKLHGMSENTHAIIYGGTYDISSHLIDSYTFDIDVKDGCWIEGRGMPKIVCESATKLTYASVFRFKQTSGKISGLNIKAKNLRYAIHDDAGGTDIVPFTHTVENCVIEYQGAEGSGMNVGRAIGAGMSNCGEHIYDGCIITDTNTYGADFHTNSCSTAETPSQPLRPAKVTVKNCMFKNCTLSFTSLSGDTGIKRDLCEAYNNSTVGAIEVLGTNAIDLVAWNNEVR